MELDKKDQLVEEEVQSSTPLREALRRFVAHTPTPDDLKLIRNAIRDGEDLHECHEVMGGIWDESFNDGALPPRTKALEKKFKKEANRIYAEYQRNSKSKSIPVPAKPNIIRFRKLIRYAAAAVLLFGLLIPAAYFFMKPKPKTEQVSIQYMEETTQRGEIKTIILPDQTKVTLNVDSRLSYPAVFADDERPVTLQGEAIFEVTSDSERPFTVTTDDMTVTVLGTVFNVKAYQDDLEALVLVASGKVEVGLKDGNILLGKDNQVRIDRATGNFEKLTIDAERFLSWADGKLYLYRTPIQEVVNMLNRSCPHMVFELAEGKYSGLISGKIDTKKLETMLDPIIKSIGLQYKKTGNKIILYE